MRICLPVNVSPIGIGWPHDVTSLSMDKAYARPFPLSHKLFKTSGLPKPKWASGSIFFSGLTQPRVSVLSQKCVTRDAVP